MTNQVGVNRTNVLRLYRTNYGTIAYVDSDVLVVGGGLAGSCAAIAAARRGVRVAVRAPSSAAVAAERAWMATAGS